MATILVIEDNETNLELMTYLLEAFGHATWSAPHGQSGISLALQQSPDLIVCDIHMPGMTGYDVARELKAMLPLLRIPLIAVTALAMVGDRDQILTAGFDGYIAKPIAPETFVRQVESFLPPIHRISPGIQPPPATDTADHAVSASAASKHVTILVVDDVPLNRELLRSLLEPSGYTVVMAEGVDMALTLAQQTRPQLILSDLHMPDRTGFELIQAIRTDAHLHDTQIIIHSATAMSDQEERKAIQLGAQAFLKRPAEPELILRKIEECLNGARE